MADNFGCRSLCCHLLSLLLIFKKSEEAVLLHLQYIILQFISVISKAVFVVENAIIDKEMHSHKLSAMADNYPADYKRGLRSQIWMVCPYQIWMTPNTCQGGVVLGNIFL